MSILIFSPWTVPAPPVFGGAIAQAAYETVVGLPDRDVQVVSPWDQRLVETSTVPGFHYLDLAGYRRALAERLPDGLSDRDTRRFTLLSAVSDTIERLDPDVVEIHNRPYVADYVSRRYPDRCAILYVHGRLVPDHGPLPAEARAFVFVSQDLKRWYVRSGWAQDECCHVVPNGVDTDRFHPSRHEVQAERISQRFGLIPGRTILYTGRIVEEKGVHLLIEAFARVRLQLPDARLLVVGDETSGFASRDRYAEQVRKAAGRIGGISFSGFVPHGEIHAYYAAADLSVVPTTGEEGFCNVVVESMASGVAVLAARSGAVPDLIDHGQTGFLLDDPRDVDAAADRIATLLLDEQTRRQTARRARRHVARTYTVRRRLEALSGLYDHLEAETNS